MYTYTLRLCMTSKNNLLWQINSQNDEDFHSLKVNQILKEDKQWNRKTLGQIEMLQLMHMHVP